MLTVKTTTMKILLILLLPLGLTTTTAFTTTDTSVTSPESMALIHYRHHRHRRYQRPVCQPSEVKKRDCRCLVDVRCIQYHHKIIVTTSRHHVHNRLGDYEYDDSNSVGTTNLSRNNEPITTTITTARNKLLPVVKRFFNVNRSLFIFYSFVGNIIIPQACINMNTDIFGMTILATLWMGFVLAISGMEAWLKFRAPFVPRPFLLDVGRTVFPALNSVEGALCASIWRTLIFHYSSGGGLTGGTSSGSMLDVWSLIGLSVATTILVVDVVFLTPLLEIRAKQAVYDYLRQTDKFIGSDESSTDWIAFQKLQEDLQKRPKRNAAWHFVYVGLELVKISSLLIATIGGTNSGNLRR